MIFACGIVKCSAKVTRVVPREPFSSLEVKDEKGSFCMQCIPCDMFFFRLINRALKDVAARGEGSDARVGKDCAL